MNKQTFNFIDPKWWDIKHVIFYHEKNKSEVTLSREAFLVFMYFERKIITTDEFDYNDISTKTYLTIEQAELGVKDLVENGIIEVRE
jgi:hypothetical protein